MTVENENTKSLGQEDSSSAGSEYSRVFDSYEIPTTSIPEAPPIPSYSEQNSFSFKDIESKLSSSTPLKEKIVADEEKQSEDFNINQEIAYLENNIVYSENVIPEQEHWGREETPQDYFVEENVSVAPEKLAENIIFSPNGEKREELEEELEEETSWRYELLPEKPSVDFNELEFIKEKPQDFLPGTEELVDSYIENLPPLPPRVSSFQESHKFNNQTTIIPVLFLLLAVLSLLFTPISQLSFVSLVAGIVYSRIAKKHNDGVVFAISIITIGVSMASILFR